ncbi:hypothetical protein J4423_01745 [Candidatus Pacearchaeota archaeon]|nr:hypothetical protein [Candidatus Pacearchaeota archaeon]
MAEKDVILKEKVKFVGYAKFNDLYSYAFDWVKGEGYKIIEDTYTEKVKGNAKDLEIVWKASKKITDYFKVEIEFKWRIFGMEDVEVEVDGKKKKMNKFVELGIEIKGTLVKDFANQWNVSGTTKFFREIYNKYVIPGRTVQMEEKVEKDVQDFKEEVKAFLELTGKKQIVL